jgi:vacuolar-type H+-ATPase subunit C/Vma6
LVKLVKSIDLTSAVIKASARKGALLTDQQLIDLTSSKDLKDLLNRIKERCPNLSSVALTPKAIEEGFLDFYRQEISEFQKVAPDISMILNIVRREVDEGEAVELLKTQLGIIAPIEQKRTKDDITALLKVMGFSIEAKKATLIYEKYKVPALIDSEFARQRIIDLSASLARLGGNTKEKMKDYLNYKIDVFNLDLLIRGLKNDIDRKALSELLIYNGGSVKSQILKEAVKQPTIEKVLTLIEGKGLPKVESARDLERYFEQKVSRLMSRTYYNSYTEVGAVLGYLELRLREIKDIIRIANAISRGLEPKKIAQEFIF